MDGTDLHAVTGGVDHAVDQVRRREAFEAAHPRVQILTPEQREIVTNLWLASWVAEGLSPGDPGAVIKVTHYDLRFLLDRLEQRDDLP